MRSAAASKRDEIASLRADDDEYERDIQVDESDNEATQSQFDSGLNNPSTTKGIRISVAALKPYLSHSVKPKVTQVYILEILPNGEKGYCGPKTMSQLLQFVYSKTELEVPRVGLGRLPSKQGELKEINHHDLRCLENQFHIHEEPIILVRKHAVLFSMNPFRAIVTAEKMILIVPVEAESLLSVVYDHMKGIFEDVSEEKNNQANGVISPEIKGYKAMLATITALHRQDYSALAKKVESELDKIKSLQKITAEKQDSLRALKNSVLSQIIKIDGYRRLLKDVFWNDRDLALMNLSILQENPLLYSDPTELEALNQRDDISILLESYLMDHHAIGTKLKFIQAQIQSSEELVSFRLDMYRNDLLFVEMILIICMLSLTVGSFVTSSFGMNLATGIPTDNYLVFWIFSICLTLFLIALTWILIARYRLTGSISATIVKG